MKTKIIIVKKINNTFEKQGEKNLKTDIYDIVGDSTIKEGEQLCVWKKHVIPVPPKNPYAFVNKKNRIIFFDIDKKEFIDFQKKELGLSTEFLEQLFGRKILVQLAKVIKTSTDKENTNFDFLKYGIAGVLIFVAGYLSGSGALAI